MIILGLGSNLATRYGGRRLIILRALEKLESRGVRIVKSSPFYETSNSFSRRDPLFVNMVARVETEQSPQDLLETCNSVAYDLGRTRISQKGPRIIDIDLLIYNDDVIKTKTLTVPHITLHENTAYLYPLSDLVSHWIHPISQQSIQEMIERIPVGQSAHKM